MSWNTLQAQVQGMGFGVAFRTQWNGQGGLMPDLAPPTGGGWLLVGCYDNVAAFWVKPLTDSTRKLNASLVRKLMADCDPFIGTLGGYEADFSDANALLPADSQNQNRKQNQERDALALV